MSLFEQTVWEYYQRHGRYDLPWRKLDAHGQINPYHVLVSELMLQQTQVPRVMPKFVDFVERFPSFAVLAQASLAEVLQAWSGLGYNRRAKYLWQTARMVVAQHGGELPQTSAELVKLPGIGPNTAGAIMAYAYNKPVVFVETNIRTVFIHHFFATEQQVSDKQILDLLKKTFLDPGAARSPEGMSRYWYWALMDYGTYLKQTVGNMSVRSKHYTKQSTFEGSKRQVRGRVLKELLIGPADQAQLARAIPDERLAEVLKILLREGLVAKTGQRYRLADS